MRWTRKTARRASSACSTRGSSFSERPPPEDGLTRSASGISGSTPIAPCSPWREPSRTGRRGRPRRRMTRKLPPPAPPSGAARSRARRAGDRSSRGAGRAGRRAARRGRGAGGRRAAAPGPPPRPRAVPSRWTTRSKWSSGKGRRRGPPCLKAIRPSGSRPTRAVGPRGRASARRRRRGPGRGGTRGRGRAPARPRRIRPPGPARAPGADVQHRRRQGDQRIGRDHGRSSPGAGSRSSRLSRRWRQATGSPTAAGSSSPASRWSRRSSSARS